MTDELSTNPPRVCVFQSFRTTRVPAWITRCLSTVSDWSASRGYDYRFFGDEIFDLLPGPYREACKGRMWPMSDLARLLAARDLLAEGYSRAIWFDADQVIFNAAALRIDLEPGFSFCREAWLGPCENPLKRVLKERTGISRLWSRDAWRGIYTAFNVNNACFCVGRSWFLDSYIESVQYAGTKMDEFRPMHMGPDMVSAYHGMLHYPLIRHVGSFSAILIDALANGSTKIPRAFARLAGEPVYAANLCGSENIGEQHYDAAIERLVSSGGDVINRFLDDRAAPR